MKIGQFAFLRRNNSKAFKNCQLIRTESPPLKNKVIVLCYDNKDTWGYLLVDFERFDGQGLFIYVVF